MRTRKILAGDCARRREKRSEFAGGEDCVDGGCVNDEASDIRLAVENMDQGGEGEDYEQGIAPDRSGGRDEEEKRGDDFGTAENGSNQMRHPGPSEFVRPRCRKDEQARFDENDAALRTNRELKWHS